MGRTGLAPARHVSIPGADGCPHDPPYAAVAAAAPLTGFHPGAPRRRVRLRVLLPVRRSVTKGFRRAVSGLRPKRVSL